MSDNFAKTLAAINACTICAEHLPVAPRPVVQIHPEAKILIAGQAPGRKVYQSGIAFDDASGERLRAWMGVNRQDFYDAEKVAILPMGFCYPGTGTSGDLPPRPECAEHWRRQVMQQLENVRLTLLIGQYAQRWHLGSHQQTNLTATVRAWQSYTPDLIPLPHPSPRNNRWLKANPWFDAELVPYLQRRIAAILSDQD